MGRMTKIEWTDHTFNCWRGCTKVSPGCKFCYAEKGAKRNPKMLGIWGVNGTRVAASESKWLEPFVWDREAAELGVRARVFCASLADVFEGWQGPMVDASGNILRSGEGLVSGRARSKHWYSQSPCDDQPGPLVTMSDVRARLFAVIDATPNLDWQLVTKRPENILSMWPGGRRENVWLVTSVEDQLAADERIDSLLKCRHLSPVLGLSMEPLLEYVDLSKWLENFDTWPEWIILGGESGYNARPFDTDWAARIINDLDEAGDGCRGVAVFMKQLGANPFKNGVKLELADAKGGDPDGWDQSLGIREFPTDFLAEVIP